MADRIVTNSANGGNSSTLRLKLSSKASEIPCTISPAVYGPAYLTIYYHECQDYIQVLGDPGALAAELRRLADMIEPTSVKERHKREVLRDLAQVPAVLENPKTAWPWLVARFPWLFDGIEVSREPYASYLRSGPADLALLEPYRGQTLSQADVAQILFADRTKTGGSYRRRILSALAFLDTTTSAEAADNDDLEQIAA